MMLCYYFAIILSISHSLNYNRLHCYRFLKSRHFLSHINTKLFDNNHFSKSSSLQTSSNLGNRIIHRIRIDDVNSRSESNSNSFDIPEQFSSFGKRSTAFSPGNIRLTPYEYLQIIRKKFINSGK